MPNYEYKCRDCQKIIERQYAMNQQKPETIMSKLENCEKQDTCTFDRQFKSSINTFVKGTYNGDYRK
jgi:predicted nucleic acid-binding Zn ribbon protein